uniref:Uncharacterized protein n=1 Tax=Panagrolaimus sp. ES5 TaxID=591445 RepID=A0AC34G0V4_9BILA
MTEIIVDNKNIEIKAEPQEVEAEKEVIKCKDSVITEKNTAADDSADMAFNECSINNQKEIVTTNGNSYWTINDDENSVEVDAALEADESSIASSLKETNSSYPFLQANNSSSEQIRRQQEVMADARGRSVSISSSVSKKEGSIASFLSSKNASVSRTGSMVRETTQVVVDDPSMTYKVITTKEKLTLDNAFPSLDDTKALIPALEDLPTIKELSLDKITQLLREIAFRYQRMPFFRYRLFTLFCLSISYFILPGFITGLLFGLYLSIIAFLFVCVSDPIIPGTVSQQQFQHVVDQVSDYSKKEEATPKVYKDSVG